MHVFTFMLFFFYLTLKLLTYIDETLCIRCFYDYECMISFQTPVSQDEAYSAFDNIGLSQSTKSLDKESLKPLVIPTDQGTVHCSSRITSYAIFVTVESACNKSLCYNCPLAFLFTVFHELYRNCSCF